MEKNNAGEEYLGYSSWFGMQFTPCLIRQPNELSRLDNTLFRLKKLGGNAKCTASAWCSRHNLAKSFSIVHPSPFAIFLCIAMIGFKVFCVLGLG